MLKNINVEMDAARVCDAIARIGYTPKAALMDIVDNSVAAGATRIIVELDKDPDKTFAENDNVLTYRVFDNGSGMDNDGVLNALRLGTKREYPENSLSKFGMGLKSAGLSLGGSIGVLSKKDAAWSLYHVVDRANIAAAGAYVVGQDEPPPDLKGRLGNFLGEASSGTVVEITNCGNRNHASARRTMTALQRELGTRYFGFLARKDGPLSITVRCTGQPDIQVQSRDILYLADAKQGFDKDTYDGKTPCKVLATEFPVTSNPADPKVKLSVVLFPKAEMANNAAIPEAERKKIKEYEISRSNKGFFIYRNGRLIRWGDDLDGLINRDLIGFRARLDLETIHDDALHVDVSKQHLSMPEDVHEKIELLTRQARAEHKDVFDKCSQLVPKNEGAQFNDRNEELAEQDLDAAASAPSPEQKKRKTALAEETKRKLKDAGEEPAPTPEAVPVLPKFERVRYSDKVAAAVAWEAGFDPNEGTFVRINKNHSFYISGLSLLDPNGADRQAIEAIFWTLAVAENLTIANLASVDAAIIRLVLEKFKRAFATNLDIWSSANQSLFTDA